MKHNFADSLALSHRHADAHWWRLVYQEAFTDLESMPSVRNDGWAQRGGIDRVLTLGCGKTLTVDEKVRSEDYDDILLEYWSDEARKVPGWVAKPLACDFIAYAFIPSQRCYLLPFQTLRRAWRDNRKTWVRDHRETRAQNSGYTTVGVAVPIPVLMNALKDAILVRWE